MTEYEALSLGEALDRFRGSNRLEDGETEQPWWRCRIGPFSLRLPNFTWRRRAIMAHDLHHVLTGYPCSMSGECRIASGEFGAGRMPHWGAYLFCLPLLVAGLFWSPRAIFRAFADGQRSGSLHSRVITEEMLAAPLPIIRSRLASRRVRKGSPHIAFAVLLLQAALVLLIPVVMAIMLISAAYAVIQ